ncbi:MAG: hypothetical protein AAFX50_25955, partial [Acidobacteriota bacterium]
MSTVDRQVRAYYEGQGLSASRAEEILHLARRRQRRQRRRLLLAVAAALLLVVGAALVQRVFDIRALGDRVAAEVAM